MKVTKLFNLNDPSGGKNLQNEDDSPKPSKPSVDIHGGPPDLDQVWSDFEGKIKSIVGGRKSSKNTEPPPPPNGQNGGSHRSSGSSKPIKKGIFFAILLIVVIWLCSSFYIVKEGQVGVVTQFGKYYATVQPGFNWHLPYPIQDVELVDIANVRSFSIGYRDNARNKVAPEALMLTEDENIVDVQFDVQYRLKTDGTIKGNQRSSAANYLFSTVNPDESVRQAAETAMREVVGKQTMDRILYESRTQAAQDVAHLMQQILDRYNTGIEIITVAIQNVQPPEQVQAAFEDAIKAGQDNERQKNEGNAYASRVIPEASGQAFRMVQDAEGYRARVVGQAQGEAQRFEAMAKEYHAAPEITRERLYISAMSDIFQHASKVMVDTTGKQAPLMLMPLDKWVNKQGSTTKVSTPESSTPTKKTTQSTSTSATQATAVESAETAIDDRTLTRDRQTR